MFLAVSVGNGLRGRITLQKIFIGSRARGGRVTPVGRTRLGRGAVEPRARGDENQGERNNFLRFQEQLLRRKKTGVVFGCFCWKWVARGNNFVEEKAAVRGRGAVASRPWGDRVLGAGRSNRGRGAMKIKEEETTFCAFRNNF